MASDFGNEMIKVAETEMHCYMERFGLGSLQVINQYTP